MKSEKKLKYLPSRFHYSKEIYETDAHSKHSIYLKNILRIYFNTCMFTQKDQIKCVLLYTTMNSIDLFVTRQRKFTLFLKDTRNRFRSKIKGGAVRSKPIYCYTDYTYIEYTYIIERTA